MAENKELNRLKVILVEKKKSNLWLSREYGIYIFSGAGGLSLGAEMAGIRISTAIEINASAAKTFLRNHKGATVIQDDRE